MFPKYTCILVDDRDSQSFVLRLENNTDVIIKLIGHNEIPDSYHRIATSYSGLQ